MGFLRSIVADARSHRSSSHSQSVISPESKQVGFFQQTEAAIVSADTDLGAVAKSQPWQTEMDVGINQGNHASDSFVTDPASLSDSAMQQSVAHSVPPESIRQDGAITGENNAQFSSDNSPASPATGQKQGMVISAPVPAKQPLQSPSVLITASLDLSDDGEDSAVACERVESQPSAFDHPEREVVVEHSLVEELSDEHQASSIGQLLMPTHANEQLEIKQDDSVLPVPGNADAPLSFEHKAISGQMLAGVVEENRNNVSHADALSLAPQQQAEGIKRNDSMADSSQNRQRSVDQVLALAPGKESRPEASFVEADKITSPAAQATAALPVGQKQQVKATFPAEKTDAPVLSQPAQPDSVIKNAVKSAKPAKMVQTLLARPLHQASEYNPDKAAKNALGRTPAKKSSEVYAGPKVQIGQIDVTIEVQQRSEKRTARTASSGSIASRHYLRGL